MAEYPNGNPGEYPLDPASEVGQYRLIFGDTNAEEYDPAVPGQRTYTYFSDAEITAMLAQAGTTTRAVAYGYLKLASAAAVESKSVKDYDLQIDLTKRAADLRATAQVWFERADDEDDADGNADIFDLVDLAGTSDPIAEGTMAIYGRTYTWGRL